MAERDRKKEQGKKTALKEPGPSVAFDPSTNRQGGGVLVDSSSHHIDFIGGSMSGNNGPGLQIGAGAHHIATRSAAIDNNNGPGVLIESSIASSQPEPPENGDEAPAGHWHKKPIGVIGMGVTVALLSAAALWAVSHYFG
jgi:hypothetical protein